MNARRLPALALLLGLSVGLSACETSDIVDKMYDFNPFGANKAKLPGERKPVFSEGTVPGVQQGVPPEYMKGAAQEEAAEAAPKVAEKPKRQRAKPRRVARPAKTPREAPAREAVVSPGPQPKSSGPASAWEDVPVPTGKRARPAAARPASTASAPATQSQPASAPAAAGGWAPPAAAQVPTAWPDPPK